MYTSGTTGDPKGVMVSNDSIVTFIAGANCLLGNAKAEVIPEINLKSLTF